MKGLDKMNRLSPLTVQAYLKNSGWQKVQSKREEVAIFQKELKGDFFEIILPKDRTLLDYQRAMLRVVETIAASEEREIEAVITDLSWTLEKFGDVRTEKQYYSTTFKGT